MGRLYYSAKDASGNYGLWVGNHIVHCLAVTTRTLSEHIVGTGDLNGDGIADILLHYDNDHTNILELNAHATGSQLLHTEAVHHDPQRLGNGEPSFRSRLVNLIDVARSSLAEIAWFVERR